MVKKIFMILIMIGVLFTAVGAVLDFVKTGYKFDGVSYNIDTWYLHENKIVNRKTAWIMNNGVDNDLSTGILYISVHEEEEVETAAITSETILILNAGDMVVIHMKSNVHLSIQGDTTDINCLIYEFTKKGI